MCYSNFDAGLRCFFLGYLDSFLDPLIHVKRERDEDHFDLISPKRLIVTSSGIPLANVALSNDYFW